MPAQPFSQESLAWLRKELNGKTVLVETNLKGQIRSRRKLSLLIKEKKYDENPRFLAAFSVRKRTDADFFFCHNISTCRCPWRGTQGFDTCLFYQ